LPLNGIRKVIDLPVRSACRNVAFEEEAIMIVICSLLALMKDQVSYLSSIGLKAVIIGGDQDEKVCRAVENGEYTFVFMSQEVSLSHTRWRTMVHSQIYKDRLMGIVIDEVHCLTQWGLGNNRERTAFRLWYSRLNELRSFVKNCPFMALTATATKSTKEQIIDMLDTSGGFGEPKP